MRAVKSVSIDSERRVIITYLDGSTETLYPNCIWCDSEALRQLIKDLLEEKADAITQTIENVTIASFADGADEGLIKKLLVSIEPIQEGTGDPSPENVRPITGRTGLNVVRARKNLIPANSFTSATKQGLTYTVNNDGTVSVSGTATTNSYLYYSTIFPVDVIINGIPEIGGGVIDGTAIQIYSEEASIDTTVRSNNNTFVLLANHRVEIRLRINSGVTLDNALFKPMARISTDTDYSFEPYKGNAYSVNWETEAGTVYGGTLDVTNGVLTVDRAMVNLGTLNWSKINTTGSHWRFWAYLNDMACVGEMLSSQYKHITASQSYIGDIGIASQTSGSSCLVMVTDERFSDAATFKTAMSGVQLVYELATPTEIQLTPQEVRTLLGVNNVWSDSGNILELEYTADTKLYIVGQQSGTLGSGRHTITNLDIQPVSEKTWEDVAEAYKEEATDERGEE